MDAEGWAWASTKAFFWLLVIIMALGYIPDRAYYFFVSRTIDLGIVGWAPVNLCPPENTSSMPCPVPAGAVLPWQGGATQAALPQPRTGGAAVQIGTNLLYIGGNDGSGPSATTFATKVGNGAFGPWTEGAALPEARDNAALAVLSGTAYLVGGVGPDGEPTNTVWKIGLNPDTSELTGWAPAQNGAKKDVTLPEARAGAAALAVADGILVVGGRGPDGKPTTTVWKSTLDKNGLLGAFQPQPSLPHAVADATVALEGTFVWVYGGADEAGPTAVVQRADYGGAVPTSSTAPGAASAAANSGPPATPAASGGAPAASGAGPAASGATSQSVAAWAVQDASNLPGPRSGAA